MLQFRLVKYADPENYQAFLDELLQRSIKTGMLCDLSIKFTRNKLYMALRLDQIINLSQNSNYIQLGEI